MKHNWEYKRLGDVCKLCVGGDKPADISEIQNSDNSIPVFSNGIENEGLYGYCKKSTIQEPSVTISGRGTLGVPFIRRNPFVPIVRLVVATPDYSLRLEYLYYWLLFRKFSGNGAAIPQLTVPMIRNEVIPVPPIEVQERIVAELDKINEVVEDCRELLRNLNALAQSLFYDTFGDPVSNPKCWTFKQIKSLLSLKAGKSIKASELLNHITDGYYPCYGGNGIRGYISKKSHHGLYNIIGRQGALSCNITLANGDFYATEHAVVVSPLIESSPYWLYYMLSALNLNKYAKGVAQPGLSVGVINEISIPVPPLALQQRFATQVEAIEAQKANVEATIAEMQTLLASRMDYWFND